MSKRIFIFLGCFVLILGIAVYAEKNGMLGGPDSQTSVPENDGNSGKYDNDRAGAKFEETFRNRTAEGVDLAGEIFRPILDTSPFNEELQQYRTEQVSLQNNSIIMTADKKPEGYVSGKVESKIGFRYGKFSFRVRTTNGTGLFPAIWMLSVDGYGYPEIDIYEMIGSDPDRIYGVMHYMEAGNKKRNYFEHQFPEENVPETYVISYEWTPDKMDWYVNDEMVHSIQKKIPDVPMFMIMNLAVGGKWPGNPAEDTQFPTDFEVEILQFEPEEIYIR